MQPLARLKGHRERVLYMTAAPDGQTIVTGSADETSYGFGRFSPKSEYH